MQEMLDRITERNFGKQIELKEYQGNDPADLGLIAAGIKVASLFVNGKDMKISIYGFNLNRKAELDEHGDYDDTKELDRIITDIIRVKFE